MRERPLCVFCLLFLIVQIVLIRGFRLEKDWYPSLLEKTVKEGSVLTTAGVVSYTEIKKDYLIVYLTAKSYQTNIIVYIKQENSSNQHISIGNEIEVTGEVTYFDEPRNPGNFNQKFFYQKQGIHGSIFASKYQIINASKNIWKESLAQLRIRWKNLLIKTLGETDGSTMSAILLGDKNGLDGNLKELYQKNGIGHILAISGLHMTFIGLGFYQILRKRGFSFVSAGIIGILFLISYSVMIGNGVASVRALVMFVVRIGADMAGRVYDMLTALALAAIVILVWRPLYLYDAGFLLSFGAILGILLIHPLIEFKKKKDSSIAEKLGRKLWEGLWGSLSINLMILPCMLYFFFEFPIYSVFMNLLVIPLMSIVLGAGVLGSFLSVAIPFAGTFCGGIILLICRPVLAFYEMLCKICIRFPGNHLVLGQPELWQIILYYVLLGTALLYAYRKRRWAVSIALVVLSLPGLCIRWNEIHPLRQEISITMLDVGQGDGLVIKSPGGMVCMIDGGSSDVSEVGKYRLEPYLKSQGISTLNYVFVSHGDSDHYNGVEEMLQRQEFGVRIRYLVLPVQEMMDDKLKSLAMTAHENGTEVVTISPGDSVSDPKDDLSITCIQPGKDDQIETGNAGSMVLSLTCRKFDMLFTGDVEGAGEELLEKRLDAYEVLKVAHHGSKNSSSKELLDIVQPKLSLISAGEKNRYGHPHKETITRLKEAGSRILSTQDYGAITVRTDGNSFTIRSEIEYNMK
ncbi:MAG: DNA internalization-related competence protein ComEC/Rec2 [Hespellia sp.]|nr:DNA internalization-related competence protein ComEC/Rec2 [Hespellia sp.]